MRRHLVVAVDPGPRGTGIVAMLVGDRPAADVVVAAMPVEDLDPRVHMPGEQVGVAGAGLGYRRDVACHIERLVETGWEAGHHVVAALEAVTVPQHHIGGRKAFISPADVMALTGVHQAALSQFEHLGLDVVQIRPGGNGSNPWACYPSWAMSPRERTNAQKNPEKTAGDSNEWKHVRSAYDVFLKTVTDRQLRTRPPQQ